MSLVVGTNSYVTAAEADALLLPHPRREVWGAHSDYQRELALLLAAREIDLLNFRGRVADTDQALAWPRAGVIDSDGRIIDSDTVPDRVKTAQAELALDLLAEGFESEDEIPRGVRRVRAGAVELEFTAPTRGELPDAVRDVLRPLLEGEHSLRLVP